MQCGGDHCTRSQLQGKVCHVLRGEKKELANFHCWSRMQLESGQNDFAFKHLASVGGAEAVWFGLVWSLD